MADRQTLDFYDGHAAAYADRVAGEADHPALYQFADMLSPGARILDFGCGPAYAAHRFREMGFEAEGYDGSAGLAAQASARYGINVTIGAFADFDADSAYDGIWASFCLLHDSRAAMPDHLDRLHRALHPGGALYIGLKEGKGAERDDLGRQYTYFTEREMRGLLTRAGFAFKTAWSEPSTGFSGIPCQAMHLFAHA